MQFLLSVIDDMSGRTEAELEDPTALPEEAVAIDAFNERLRSGGQWLFAAGLASPHSARIIDNRGAEPMVTDGPFAESKEFLAGFWIVEAADLATALALATDGSKACNRKVEVRQIR